MKIIDLIKQFDGCDINDEVLVAVKDENPRSHAMDIYKISFLSKSGGAIFIEVYRDKN